PQPPRVRCSLPACTRHPLLRWNPPLHSPASTRARSRASPVGCPRPRPAGIARNGSAPRCGSIRNSASSAPQCWRRRRPNRAARDETALLEALSAERQALVDSDRARVQLGDLARTQMLADELELARARQRRQQSRTRAADAVARLAAAVGVPSTALASASVRW